MSFKDVCEKCGFVLSESDQDFYESRLCKVGYCVLIGCPDCGKVAMSYGPVGCPVCSPYRSPSLKRVRLLYRQKRRGPKRWR